ncbi:hypothetical protein D9M72_511890 [compost metagenome]
MHHLEGGGAAIDDDRLAILAERHRLLGDRLLLAGVQAFVDLERPTGKADELRRVDRLRAATHPAQLLLHMECRNVAPDRRLGTVGQIDQFLDGDDGFFLNRRQNDPVSFFLVHAFLRWRSCFHHDRPLSITINHIFSLCSAICANLIVFD